MIIYQSQVDNVYKKKRKCVCVNNILRFSVLFVIIFLRFYVFVIILLRFSGDNNFKFCVKNRVLRMIIRISQTD